MESINIAVFEDHPIVQGSLSQLLNKDNGFNLQFIATKKSDLYELLNTQKGLEILIVDFLANDVSGTEVYEFVIKHYPAIKLIAFTSLSSPVLVENLMRAGVKGYVNKNQEIEDLLEAIKTVTKNRLYLPSEFDFLHQRLKKEALGNMVLSSREIDVIKLIALEFTTAEIAVRLNISVNSVETHRKNIFAKLNVKNVAGMIREAIHMGLVH
jgi:DNA-binding NarL/FixJ family response regulator